MLAGGGFDPAEDIAAITVNRWGHGYAYPGDYPFDPNTPMTSDRSSLAGNVSVVSRLPILMRAGRPILRQRLIRHIAL
jgi:hypothetical protein